MERIATDDSVDHRISRNTPRPATESWDNLAEWWDDAIGDGNPTQDLIVEPYTEKLLALQPGERVLDIACGAGRFARRMADAGAIVTAFDHAERFVNRARERSVGYEKKISYHVANATDPDAMLALTGGEPFDAAVCTMAIMDMAEITPLFATLPRLLKPDGRFVFSVSHPVFNTEHARPTIERLHVGTDVVNRYAVSVADYLDMRMEEGHRRPRPARSPALLRPADQCPRQHRIRLRARPRPAGGACLPAWHPGREPAFPGELRVHPLGAARALPGGEPVGRLRS